MSNGQPLKAQGEPVAGFPIRFEWQTGILYELIDRQVELITQDISRARSEGRLVVYLSCPISKRGGGHDRTNVEIAHHTARRVTTEWGHRFWLLNPAAYQLESREGTSLLQQHANARARERGEQPIDVRTLKPEGGDYMRMWTRVLVEDDGRDARMNLGGYFDAYYFLGPTDVIDFFSKSGATTLTSGVEEYFASKFTIDPEFCRDFSPTTKPDGNPLSDSERDAQWKRLRREFFRYYTIRASASYSKGAHDEWEILRVLNKKRLAVLGIGEQIAGYYDGQALAMGDMEAIVTRGYALPDSPASPPLTGEVTRKDGDHDPGTARPEVIE
jgi:hypothetical protein